MALALSQIISGGTYSGRGVCCVREVDWIDEIDGRVWVHWIAPAVLHAEWKDGRVFRKPNRFCFVETFAKWADKRVK